MQTLRWEEVLEIRNGKNQKKVEDPDGSFPIYGSGGVMGRANDCLCPKNTVILGRKGTINRPIFVGVPLWNVDTAFGLVANPKRLSPKYLYYFCVRFDFERLSATVTIPSLTKASLLKIEIPLPPLDEQERIAAELDAVAATLKKRRTQLAELDAFVEARYVELFGKLGTNPKRFPGVALGEVCRVNPKKNAALFPNDDRLVSFVPTPAVSERGEIDGVDRSPLSRSQKRLYVL